MENFESSFTSQNKPYGKIFTLIQDTILKNITNENSVFVFPTDIDANTWAEQIITSTHIKAVATERFIAWDNFKGSSIKRTEVSLLVTFFLFKFSIIRIRPFLNVSYIQIQSSNHGQQRCLHVRLGF